MADLIPIFKKELENEARTTKEMLSRIPDDKFNWKPHEKSMSISRLAAHVAEMPEWIAMAFTSDGLDFATNGHKPRTVQNQKELMALFDQSLEMGDSYLKSEFEKNLQDPWILRNGDTVINRFNKAEVVRMALNQITHHRAQLGVYLRLLNIPLPPSYGPTADTK